VCKLNGKISVVYCIAQNEIIGIFYKKNNVFLQATKIMTAMINIEIEPVLEKKNKTENHTEHKLPESEAKDSTKNKEADRISQRESPIISLKNVDIYQKKILILSDISFAIHKGEIVYVIGKTGSGKSNLLKLLYGEVPLLKGEVEVAGYSLFKIKPKNILRLRRKLGIVFQDFQLLYDRSVYENMKFVAKVTGWKDSVKIDERIEELLTLVGLRTKGHKMPHQLSGGEQQRVCIARALVNNPEIILADEPTGNLDPETSFEIFKLFHEISKKGTAVMIATHNYSIINQIPSRVLQIEQGKVFE
jgi:cell division transport system ATP-binding protein